MSEGGQPGLEALRAEIRQMEGYGLAEGAVRLSFGLEPLDKLLPEGGLPLAALHLVEPARCEWDDGLASGFLLALLQSAARSSAASRAAQAAGPVLWVSRHGDLYGPGLLPFGFSPEGFLLVTARNDREVLWCLEEGLRDAAPRAVVGELGGFERVAARRLQLAAEAAGRPCFLQIRPFARPPRSLPGGAASHWRIAPIGLEGEGRGGLPGPLRWQAELLRCRGGRAGTAFLEWDDETRDFSLAAPLCDREPRSLAARAL